MPVVPMADAKDKLSHYAAVAVSGEDVIITRHGRPYVRIVPVLDDRRDVQRRAVANLAALGDKIRADGRGVSTQQIVDWINEDRG